MKRLSKIAVKALLLAVLLAGMAAMAGISWLKSEPRVLPGIAAYLAQAIASQDWPVKASFGQVTTRWEEWRTPLMLEIRDLKVEGTGTANTLEVPRAVVAFRVMPLLRGKVVFKQITLDDAVLTLHTPEIPAEVEKIASTAGWIGSWQATFQNPTYLATLEGIFRILQKPSRLPVRNLIARNLRIDLDGPEGIRQITQEKLALHTVRNREGNELRLMLTRTINDTPSSIGLQLMEDTENSIWAKLSLDNFSTEWLKDISAGYNWYGGLGLFFGGDITGIIQRNGVIRSAEGGIAANELSGLPFSATFALKNHETLGDHTNVPEISFRADVRELPVDNFAAYWPTDVAVDPRSWVTQNLSGGKVTTGTVEVNIPAENFARGELAVDSVKAEVAFEGMQATYAEDLPPAADLKGVAHFTRDTMLIDVENGKLQNSELRNGTVSIPNIGDPVIEVIDITGQTEGPLADLGAFYTVQQKKQGTAPAFDAAKLGGTAATKFTVHLPLLKDLPFKEVAYSLSGTLSNVAHPQIAPGFAISEGNLSLTIKDNVNTVAGTARLNGTLVDLEYMTDAREGRTHDSTIHLLSKLDGQNLSTLGFPAVEGINGPVLLDYDLKILPGGKSSALIKLNLDEAALDIQDVGLTKPAGEALAVTLKMGSNTETPLLQSIDAVGKSVLVKASTTMNADGSLKQAVIDQAQFGETKGQARVDRKGNVYAVQLNMEKLDARPFLKDEAEPAAEKKKDGPTYSVKGKSRQVTMAGGEVFHNVSGEMSCGPLRCTQVRLEAKTDDNKPLTLTLTPGPKENVFAASAGNAGAVLRALDVITSMRGGNLSARATADATQPNAPFIGSVIIKDFSLVKAPILAKLLSVASFTGIIDALNGQGIGFSKLDGRYSYDYMKDTYQLEAMKMSGSAIGILASGYADMKASQIKMNGTLIPAYAINSALGKVPIIGNILGDGVLATSFAIEGPIADPKTEVFPLSTIAPGIVSDFMREIGILPSGKTPRPEENKDKKKKK